MADPQNIKFPVRKVASMPTLALPRRRPTQAPFAVSEASATARESIRAIVTASRMDDGQSDERAKELARSLRQLEMKLEERERAVIDKEAKLSDLTRELAETEALLVARETLIEIARQRTSAAAPASPEERRALDQFKEELERQEASLSEGKAAVKEREQFLEESENRLFEKVQSQQEKEIELEQKAEDLKARERRFREREASLDPKAAATLSAEDEAAKVRDEFNE